MRVEAIQGSKTLIGDMSVKTAHTGGSKSQRSIEATVNSEAIAAVASFTEIIIAGALLSSVTITA